MSLLERTLILLDTSLNLNFNFQRSHFQIPFTLGFRASTYEFGEEGTQTFQFITRGHMAKYWE